MSNPLRDAVSWQLLASLGRVLMCRGSRSNSSLSDPKSVGLDTQLLQMCNRFGIPCQLVELSGVNENDKVCVPLQVSFSVMPLLIEGIVFFGDFLFELTTSSKCSDIIGLVARPIKEVL